MTPDDFRRIATELNGVTEQSHMGHPDFRVGKTIFATLGYPDPAWGMIKLAAEEQSLRVEAEPGVFRPAAGAWGAKGSTLVRLEAADEATLRGALLSGWRRAGGG